MKIPYNGSMVKPVDKITALKQRNFQRMEGAQAHNADKSLERKTLAKAHAKVGNQADSAITLSGSKTLRALAGGTLGVVKGVFAGFVFSVIGSVALPIAAPALIMATTVAFFGAKGLRDGYYKAETNYSGLKGKKVGDKIAESGRAKAPVPKAKVMQKAVVEAKKAMPKLNAAELQAVESPALLNVDKSDTHFQDQVRAEKAQAQLSGQKGQLNI